MRRPSFEEREAGLTAPPQLDRDQVSAELRAVMWHEFSTAMFATAQYGTIIFRHGWEEILRDKHVYRDHRLDGFPSAAKVQVELRLELSKATYPKFYGLIEFLLLHDKCPGAFEQAVERALAASRAPYRILDHDTLVPLTSDAELNAVQGALNSTALAEIQGSREHLKEAASLIAGGQWAASVRESIHAVESIALVLSPGSETLGPALKMLGHHMDLHEALKRGFSAIYGYTSDSSGIRHALLDKGDAAVDEADALFMLGACASFVSYLVSKARSASLLQS